MRRDRKASTIEYKQLMKILEIAEPEEFEYFENMADLIECEYTISDAAIANLFRYVDGETLAELIENYFSDILEHLPENQDEIYLLINNIGMNLIGLAKKRKRSIISRYLQKNSINLKCGTYSILKWYAKIRNTVKRWCCRWQRLLRNTEASQARRKSLFIILSRR